MSVNIPTYRREDMLRRTIQSALDQTVRDLEINVSDNACSPSVRDLVDSFDDPRLTYLPLDENIGAYGNITRCLHLGRSPFVLVLMDDDVLHPECVELLSSALQSAPAAGIAHSAVDYIDRDGRVLLRDVNWADASGDCYERGSEFIERTLATATRIALSAAMLRRSAVSSERADPRDAAYADMGLWLRIARSWDVVYLHRSLAGVAIHADSLSAGEGLHQLDGSGRPQISANCSPHRPRDPAARRAQLQLVRSSKVRFVRDSLSGWRARQQAMTLVRRHAREELKSTIAERLDHQSQLATIRDLKDSVAIEPTLLLTPWPWLLAAAGLIGRGPYDRLVERRSFS